MTELQMILKKLGYDSLEQFQKAAEESRQAWQDTVSRLEAERDAAYKSGKLKRREFKATTDKEPPLRKAWWEEDLEPSVWKRG